MHAFKPVEDIVNMEIIEEEHDLNDHVEVSKSVCKNDILDESIHIIFSPINLNIDLFKTTTTHEEHHVHIKSNQLLNT